MKRYTVAVTLGFLILSALPQHTRVGADSTLYAVTDLGTTTDGLVPSPTGLNASGQVSGVVMDAGGVQHAVRYTPNIGWEYLPGLSSEGSFAAAINDLGDVAGYQTVKGVSHGFRYRNGSGVENIIEFANATDSFALGINNSGDVVGYSDTPDNSYGWRASIGMPAVQLPDFGGFFALACGINAAGQIVATSSDVPTASEHAYRIDVDNTVVDAQSFDGAGGSSHGCAIDEAGNIGGWAQGGSTSHAFRFDGVHLQNLEGLLPSGSSMVSSIANHVSVGSYTSTVDSKNHGFSFTDANGAVDLNTTIPADSGWFLQDAVSVNASSQIVGDGMLNGVARSYILKPLTKTDTTPPVIQSVTATPANISVVNGQLVPVSVAISATDDSGQPPTCSVSGLSGPGVSGTDYMVTGATSGSVKAIGGRTYTVGVTCSDAAGNKSSASTAVVVQNDTTAPAITSVTANPSSLQANGQVQPVTVTVSAADDSGVVSCKLTTITAAGAPAADAQITGNLTGSVNGVAGRTYTFGVQCTDFSGNASVSSVAVAAPADTTPPVISKVSATPDHIWPPNGKMVQVTLTVNATDNVDGAPSCSLTSVQGGGPWGSAVISGRLSASLRADDRGVYGLTVTCSDHAGNKATASVVVAVAKTAADPLKIDELVMRLLDRYVDDHDRDDRNNRKDGKDRGRDGKDHDR